MFYNLMRIFGLAIAPDAARLLLFAARLLPLPATASDVDAPELAYRSELVSACEGATDDRTERYVCVKIARFESNFRMDVGRCAKRGSAGEVTAWQILPRTKDEKARLCVSLGEDAKVAVERIRESRAACRALPKPDQLALYARGRCDSEEGKRLSRIRWPSDAEVRAVELP